MDHTLSAVLLFNLGFIGLLPFIFFRRDGVFNLRWFLTAAPFLLASLCLVLEWIQVVSPTLQIWEFSWVSLVLSLLSITLIAFTWGTNRIPLALWHQSNDAPQMIVTFGAYKRIRHPFYTSFILCLLAVVLHCPHALSLLALVYGVFILNWTASREEQRLSQSQFGADYLAYMKVTGRFWPKW